MSSTITVKTTTTIKADLGGVPAGFIKDQLEKGKNGSNLDEDETGWSIYDLKGAAIETEIDEVTIE